MSKKYLVLEMTLESISNCKVYNEKTEANNACETMFNNRIKSLSKTIPSHCVSHWENWKEYGFCFDFPYWYMVQTISIEENNIASNLDNYALVAIVGNYTIDSIEIFHNKTQAISNMKRAFIKWTTSVNISLADYERGAEWDTTDTQCWFHSDYETRFVIFKIEKEESEEIKMDNRNDFGLEVLRAIVNGNLGGARELISQEEYNREKAEIQAKINGGLLTEEERDKWNTNHPNNEIWRCHICKEYHFQDEGLFWECEDCGKITCHNCINEIDSDMICDDCVTDREEAKKISIMQNHIEEDLGIDSYEELIEYIALNNINI